MSVSVCKRENPNHICLSYPGPLCNMSWGFAITTYKPTHVAKLQLTRGPADVGGTCCYPPPPRMPKCFENLGRHAESSSIRRSQMGVKLGDSCCPIGTLEIQNQPEWCSVLSATPAPPLFLPLRKPFLLAPTRGLLFQH